jgi:hypothetical protein
LFPGGTTFRVYFGQLSIRTAATVTSFVFVHPHPSVVSQLGHFVCFPPFKPIQFR